MKIMLKIWVLLGVCWTSAIAQTHYEPEYLAQKPHYEPEEKSYYPSHRRQEEVRPYESASQEEIRPYEPTSHEDLQTNDPRHYQSLDSRYHRQEAESYPRQPQYHVPAQPVQYQSPEDPSYHRPQEIVYQHSPQEYQTAVSERQQPYQGLPHYSQPAEEDSKYAQEPPKYSQAPASPHPAPVPSDPKLPLYFTMYEKRVVQDPMDKYGKGPWRYLTYGHGITYGSKEPGKVFEKGYGYIRALGRDHCKLPKHLCPPSDEKPFDYQGRKEPYFGYRPH